MVFRGTHVGRLPARFQAAESYKSGALFRSFRLFELPTWAEKATHQASERAERAHNAGRDLERGFWSMVLEQDIIPPSIPRARSSRRILQQGQLHRKVKTQGVKAELARHQAQQSKMSVWICQRPIEYGKQSTGWGAWCVGGHLENVRVRFSARARSWLARIRVRAGMLEVAVEEARVVGWSSAGLLRVVCQS